MQDVCINGGARGGEVVLQRLQTHPDKERGFGRVVKKTSIGVDIKVSSQLPKIYISSCIRLRGAKLAEPLKP